MIIAINIYQIILENKKKHITFRRTASISLRSVLLWNFAQRSEPLWWDRYVFPKGRYGITTL